MVEKNPPTNISIQLKITYIHTHIHTRTHTHKHTYINTKAEITCRMKCFHKTVNQLSTCMSMELMFSVTAGPIMCCLFFKIGYLIFEVLGLDCVFFL